MDEKWEVVTAKKERKPKEPFQTALPKQTVANRNAPVDKSFSKRNTGRPVTDIPVAKERVTPSIFRTDKKLQASAQEEAPKKSQQPGILQVRKESLSKTTINALSNTSSSYSKEEPIIEKKTSVVPKKTKSVALFDLILSSKSKSKHQPNSNPAPLVLNPTLKPTPNDDFRPKQFVVKKKKKKLSIIKKRLLKVFLCLLCDNIVVAF